MYKYPFNLEFINDENGKAFFAFIPFIFDGKPLTGISCGISSRFSGGMKKKCDSPNRLNLFKNLGLNPENVYGLDQIHSRTVLAVDGSNPPLVAADGMVTQDRNITLSVTVADCLPVYLFDIKSGAFGLVHSGWKGTGIVLDAINKMKELWGTRPDNIVTVLGPCINSCCYKVDAQRAEVFENEFGTEAVRKSNGDFFLDLKAANVKLLTDTGVQNIALCNDCTFTDERLGSFRRQGKFFTHMVAVISRVFPCR